jgi:hypothetical protein
MADNQVAHSHSKQQVSQDDVVKKPHANHMQEHKQAKELSKGKLRKNRKKKVPFD